MQDPHEAESLNKNIAELSSLLEKMFSYKQVFFRGIVTGVGTFIGATIIAAIAIAIAVQVLQFLGFDGYLEPFLPSR